MTAEESRLIVAGIRQGDPAAEIALYRLIWKFRGDLFWAEDIAHDVYLQCWAFLVSGRLANPDSLGAFVATVLRNRKAMVYRRLPERIKVVPVSDDMRIEPATPETLLLSHERDDILQRKVARLPDRMRSQVVSMLRGDDDATIAQKFDVTEGAIRGTRRRAIRRLAA